MRSLLLVAAACTLARADVSLTSPSAPHTPLGHLCDAAIARAQRTFNAEVQFHTVERTVHGSYSWSDMCGVWGNYRVELAPDLRAPQSWRWQVPHPAPEGRAWMQATRRAHGWRARISVEGDEIQGPGQSFLDAFLPALDACLADH